ncbi:MAG: LPS assembly lipoprotein LptE [Tistlia sp.]|uniref:LPS assembly lipoprotein LptE n=1 Tax=Tistlia sp. TaxID=3057121 RepID=UPI0034A2AA4C
MAAGVLLLAGALAGCGLRPLYGEHPAGGTTVGELQTVRILPIADRPGQQLHNALRNELNPRGQPVDPRYNLSVDLEIQEQEVGVRKDETATRANLILAGSYRLVRNADKVLMTRGVAKSIVSYNIVDSEFGTYAAESDARDRGIDQLAQQMRLRLAAYFERLATGAVAP